MRRFALLAGIFALLTFAIPVVITGVGHPGTASQPAIYLPALPGQGGAAPSSSTAQPAQAPALPAVQGQAVFAILDQGTGQVLQVDARDYVRGAVAAEMPANFHTEALKAQAVSAHTYALYCAAQQRQSPDPALQGADFAANPGANEGYLTEDAARALYGDQFDWYWSKICQAADEVFDYVLTYDGEPILSAYHAASAGVTESADMVWQTALPYLTPVASPGDYTSPGFVTESAFPLEEARQLLLAAFPAAQLGDDPEAWIVPLEYSPSGYILSASVGGVQAHGQQVRNALGLRSSYFTYEQRGEELVFSTSGYGHGVGLSQYGADYMARQGDTFDQILAHYYPGAQLAMLAG